jgi:hypothetical protein
MKQSGSKIVSREVIKVSKRPPSVLRRSEVKALDSTTRLWCDEVADVGMQQ